MSDKALVHPDEAAAELGVPVKTLKRVAEDLGLLVRMGRYQRIERSSYTELIAGCRGKPKERAFTSARPEFGTSVTRARTTYPPALEVAQTLKSLSQTTSPAKEGQLVRLPPTK